MPKPNAILKSQKKRENLRQQRSECKSQANTDTGQSATLNKRDKQQLVLLQQEIRRKQQKAGIPDRYKNACVSQIDETISGPIHHYLDTFDKYHTNTGLYLWGDIGAGKTHAMCAIANALLAQGLSPLYYNLTSLLVELRNSFDAPQEVLSDIRYKIKHRRVLLLDDLGINKETDRVNETFYAIVNHRHDAGLPTIYTSNMPIDELEHHYMPQIASRIFGTTETVAFVGHDKRI